MEQNQINVTNDDSFFICPTCNKPMSYKCGGLYVCEECGAEQLNDFGKIKKYLEEHGPTNAIELSAKTGVGRAKISQFLRLGRVEIPENSPTFIHCKSCGVAIRYGNYCSNCAHSKNIQGAFIGEVAKNQGSKMRYLDQD